MVHRDIRIPDILWERGAFLDKHHGQGLSNWVPGEGYKLKLHDTEPDAPLSPIFVNIRTPDNPGKCGNLTASDLEVFGDAIADHLTEVRVFFHAGDEVYTFAEIGGIPEAGRPIAQAVQVAFSRRGFEFPLYSFEKDTSGGARRIVAPVRAQLSGRRLLLVDDLITRAGTKIEAIEAAREAGFMVTDLVVLVDREQGGAAELAKAGVKLHTLWPMRKMLSYYVASGRMSYEGRAEIFEYLLTTP